MAEVPARLLRLGRLPDPEFLPLERLFRRVRPDHFKDGQMLEAALPFEDSREGGQVAGLSVNREKYSLPTDVLLDHPTFGIFAFEVRGIPPRLGSADEREFFFGVEHAPEDQNFAHSEVCSYEHGRRAKPPRSVRTQFRLRLFKEGVVLRKPGFAEL